MRKELSGDDRTHCVTADVLRSRAAATVPVEARHRIGAARLEGLPENVQLAIHPSSLPRFEEPAHLGRLPTVVTPRRRLALVAAAGAAIIAGCSGQHHGNSLVEPNIAPPTMTSATPIIGPSGGIAGRFLAVGGPSGAQPTPQYGRLVMRRNGHVAMTVQVSRDGRYDFGVLPGRYTVVGYSPLYNNDHAPCRPYPPVVDVRRGYTTHINVYCERM